MTCCGDCIAQIIAILLLIGNYVTGREGQPQRFGDSHRIVRGERMVDDLVGALDAVDVYEFAIAESSEVTATISGM